LLLVLIRHHLLLRKLLIKIKRRICELNILANTFNSF